MKISSDIRALSFLAGVGAAAALAVGSPVSPLVLALIAGIVVAHLPRTSWRGAVEAPGRTALRLGIVLLGLRLSIGALVGIGVRGAIVVIATVSITYLFTRRAGRRLGVDEDVTTLIAVGFSICGAAAIAGVQDVVRARREAVAQAVAMVTLFGSAMIAVAPALARLIGLSEDAAAVWIGASIHEVGQVVAAGAIAAPAAVGVAVTIKLARVVLLAPMSVIVANHDDDSAGPAPRVPWFVIGFLVAVAVRSLDVLGPAVLAAGDRAAIALLSVGMFALGTGVHVRLLRRGSGRVLALAAVSTVVAAGVSLLLVLWLM